MSISAVRCAWIMAGVLPVLAVAQAGKLSIPDFSDLAKKATESVDITLDGDMLKSASRKSLAFWRRWMLRDGRKSFPFTTSVSMWRSTCGKIQPTGAC
jgi:hypothetical protein